MAAVGEDLLLWRRAGSESAEVIADRIWTGAWGQALQIPGDGGLGKDWEGAALEEPRHCSLALVLRLPAIPSSSRKHTLGAILAVAKAWVLKEGVVERTRGNQVLTDG